MLKTVILVCLLYAACDAIKCKYCVEIEARQDGTRHSEAEKGMYDSIKADSAFDKCTFSTSNVECPTESDSCYTNPVILTGRMNSVPMKSAIIKRGCHNSTDITLGALAQETECDDIEKMMSDTINKMTNPNFDCGFHVCKTDYCNDPKRNNDPVDTDSGTHITRVNILFVLLFILIKLFM